MNQQDLDFSPMEHVSAPVARVLAKADPYAFWRKALDIGGGRQIPRDRARDMGTTTEPQPGFYRKRSKDGPDVPVAIWREDSGMVAVAGGKPVEADAIWTWCCTWPISEADYRTVADGGAWANAVPAARGIGDNLPSDPHEAAKVEFAGARELVDEFLRQPIASQDDADKAAVWAKQMNEIHGTVDKLFRAEKDPIVAAGKVVDDTYRWREDAKTLATRLKRHTDAWLARLAREEDDRRRKAEEAALAARRAAEEAERAKLASVTVDDGESERRKAEADRLAAAAAAAEREAQARPVFAGRTGAKVSLRTYYVATITDYPTLLMELKDTPEVREAVEKVAGSIARGKGPVPAGMQRTEEKRAA